MNINKMRRTVLLVLSGAIALGVGACEPSPKSPAPNNAPVNSSSPVNSATPVNSASPVNSANPTANADKGKVDALVGKWSGADNASLEISKKGDKYSLVITKAGNSKTFEGTAKGDAIEFTRDGKTESAKASTGADTGVKGFEKETNCVVIAKGEGYCKK